MIIIFDPKTKKFPYPTDTASHYITIKKDNKAVFDKDYPYVDTSFSMRFRQALVRILLYLIVFPVARVRLGLRIHGRKNLKKHKEILKNGVVSISNHVHFWDYIAVMRALVPKKTNILAWDRNVRGENGPLMRLVGGIPVPEGDIHASIAMMKSVCKMLDQGGWLHVYSEGSMWEYYRPIRPFKNGAAYLACKYDKPLVPLAFTYREPGFIRKKIFRQIALFDIHIGEPIFADKTLPKDERVNDLLIRSHEAVCKLAGFKDGENLYPPVYDKTERIDYYG